METSVHNPTVDGIVSLNTDEPKPFHVVTVRDNSTGGAVVLFIAADWSDWDAMVDKVTEYRQTAAVRALGAEHGHAAGTWAVDGNTSRETAQRIIAGYEDGDPEVMDMQPSPLSGEWADGVLPRDVYREAGIDVDALDGNGEPIVVNEPTWLLEEYESAYGEAYWAEVLRAARIIAPVCMQCGKPVERNGRNELLHVDYMTHANDHTARIDA